MSSPRRIVSKESQRRPPNSNNSRQNSVDGNSGGNNGSAGGGASFSDLTGALANRFTVRQEKKKKGLIFNRFLFQMDLAINCFDTF